MVAGDGCFAKLKGGATVGLLAVLLCGSAAKMAKASTPENMLELPALLQMEDRADHADPREQAFLYTEVLHNMTELAGRQMSAGQDDDATKTVSHMDGIVAKMQRVAAKNSKRLKNAEELLEHTTHRLADMVRVANSGQQDLMKATLQKLNQMQSSVLAMVFAK